jgi:PAS domain S-box-containing protein
VKLTPKFTLVFVLYAVALLASVAWLSYTSGRESLRSATVSELQSTAIEKQSALNEWVEEKRTDIAILAASPTALESARVLGSTPSGSLEAQAAHDRFVMEVGPHVLRGEFLVVMLLDPSSGQVIAATDPSEEGKFKEDRLFYLNGKTEPYVQNVYYSISIQGPAMMAAAPLRSADGKLLGVLAGRLDLDEMNAIINRQAGLWETEEAFLVNSSHLFVTQPRLNTNPFVLQRGVHTEGVNRCLAESNGTLSDLDYRGNPALIAYRWLPGQDLCLIVKIDQNEALAPAYEFGGKVAIISGLALLGATILGALFSRSITRPIRALQAGAVRFGRGELDIHLPEKGQDELGDLAREFNKMAASLIEKEAQLHEYATGLERKVEERTVAIKQREERYRSLFENMLNGFAYCQMLFDGERPQDFIYLNVNIAFENLTGLKDVVGKKVSEVIPGILEADSGLIETYGRVSITGKPEVFETYVEALKMWFSISVYSPQKGYFVAIFDVITERKLTENALRQTASELEKRTRELNAILSSVQDYIYIFDSEGRFVFANKKLLDLWGLTAEQAFGKTMRELDYPETVETTLWEGAQRVFETGQPDTNVTQYVSPAGSTGFYENILAPMIGTDSKVSFIAGTSRDITERKRAEEEIASLSKFPTENPNPVLRVQNDGQLLYANKASRELLDLWGCEIDGYLPSDLKDLISDLVESGSIKSVDIPCNDKVYAISLVPVAESGYVNMYGSDITERKHTEDDLKRSNTELEQFAYVASHDLQEPLRGIAGMSQLLQQRYQAQLDERADEYISHIVDGTQRMQTLINDLLAYSRIGRRGEPVQVTEAEAALQATLENLSMAIQEYGVSITNESLPTVQADPTQLIQLFQNLIGNALKFRAERPPQIHIGVTEADGFWQFSVRDNGIGIESQYFERIFQVFQRLHTRREYRGTGIGLAICKKIIDRHGGRIWVESEAGQGATFYFTLPKGK